MGSFPAEIVFSSSSSLLMNRFRQWVDHIKEDLDVKGRFLNAERLTGIVKLRSVGANELILNRIKELTAGRHTVNFREKNHKGRNSLTSYTGLHWFCRRFSFKPPS